MKVLELGFNFNIIISTQLSHKALVLAPNNVHISLMKTDETVLRWTANIVFMKLHYTDQYGNYNSLPCIPWIYH